MTQAEIDLGRLRAALRRCSLCRAIRDFKGCGGLCSGCAGTAESSFTVVCHPETGHLHISPYLWNDATAAIRTRIEEFQLVTPQVAHELRTYFRKAPLRPGENAVLSAQFDGIDALGLSFRFAENCAGLLD